MATLPIPNRDDPDHYLPPAKAREHIESNKMTADDLRALIPSVRKEAEKLKNANGKGGKEMKELKKLDGGQNFDSTKVRATVNCISCSATRAIYSKYAVGQLGKPAPSKVGLEKLQRSLETGAYTCGSKLKGRGQFFYSRRALKCGMPIEASYYNPSTGTKGGRIVTEDICAVCYVNADLVSPNQIRKERNDIGGKTPLTMCRACVNSPGVTVPFLGKRVNFAQKKRQEKGRKNKQMEEAVSSGRKKRRSAN